MEESTNSAIGDDAQLHSSAQSPDQWVDAYGDRLFRFAVARVGDRDTAEEVVEKVDRMWSDLGLPGSGKAIWK